MESNRQGTGKCVQKLTGLPTCAANAFAEVELGRESRSDSKALASGCVCGGRRSGKAMPRTAEEQ